MKQVIYRMVRVGIFMLITTLILSSCVNLKKTQLLQEKSITDYSSEIVNSQRNDYKINFGDHLYIKIYSTDPKTSKFFQTDFPELMSQSYVYLNSYKVDGDGNVNFSFAGKMYVKGSTLEEAQNIIRAEMEEYFKDVNVFLKLVSFDVSVLGEVKSPGTYHINREEVTILQVLGMAGGLTDYSKATKVTLVRKSSNGSTVKYIDLTDNGVLESNHLFLLPDDVIYVAPRAAKSFAFDKFPYGLVFSIASMGLAIYSILK